ncbi:unnamed protein product, partial [Brenthis ino]
MEGKKISFGFTKTKTANKPVIVEKKEYIDCVEEKSIKVVGGEIKEEIKPLVIPMKPNTLITADRLKEIAAKVENFEEPDINNDAQEKHKDVVKDETLDQMAIRELLEDAKKEKTEEKPNFIVPVNAKPVMDGQAEATLDDYDSVPIQEFGIAMLRGMGWTPSKDQSKYRQPLLRPKGLGLGADKMVKDNQNKKGTKDKDEELSIVKNSFVKITSGKHSGYYGKVVSLDEDNGRVVVDITIKKETVSLSEFMMQAVTKTEFDKQSKVINTDSYEEYKKKEVLNSKQNSSKTEDIKSASSSKRNEVRDRDKEERHGEERLKKNDHSNGRSRERNRRDSSGSEDRRHRKKYKKKYSSNESLSSDSDKPRHRRRSSSSDSPGYHKKESKKKKKDIDKKRKGKKKKRDRDRSPNYKKYRK